MVHARAGDRVEVVLGDPRLPVVGERRLRLFLPERFRVRVLVHHAVAQGENRRRDPRLEDEPAAQVDATDLVVTVVEGNVSFVEKFVQRSTCVLARIILI